MKLQTKIRTNPTVPDKNTEPDYFLYHDEDKKKYGKNNVLYLIRIPIGLNVNQNNSVTVIGLRKRIRAT